MPALGLVHRFINSFRLQLLRLHVVVYQILKHLCLSGTLVVFNKTYSGKNEHINVLCLTFDIDEYFY
jgi:uncharacterized protein (DUF488 family)